jgi:hypothetical protein
MNADHPGHARIDRAIDRIECARDHVGRVADQGRQERGCAERRMRGADRGDALDRRHVVEQHAATAVDLRVDEPRHQPTAIEIDDVFTGRARVDPGDAAVGDHERRFGQQPRSGDDMAVGKADGRHSVRVTLLR